MFSDSTVVLHSHTGQYTTAEYTSESDKDAGGDG